MINYINLLLLINNWISYIGAGGYSLRDSLITMSKYLIFWVAWYTDAVYKFKWVVTLYMKVSAINY